MFQPLFFLKVSVAVSVELWYMFVLQGGERMKYKLLKDLYDCFYTPPELQPSTEQSPTKNSAPEPTPPQPSKELQPGDKVLCSGLWLGGV